MAIVWPVGSVMLPLPRRDATILYVDDYDKESLDDGARSKLVQDVTARIQFKIITSHRHSQFIPFFIIHTIFDDERNHIHCKGYDSTLAQRFSGKRHINRATEDFRRFLTTSSTSHVALKFKKFHYTL